MRMLADTWHSNALVKELEQGCEKIKSKFLAAILINNLFLPLYYCKCITNTPLVITRVTWGMCHGRTTSYNLPNLDKKCQLE